MLPITGKNKMAVGCVTGITACVNDVNKGNAKGIMTEIVPHAEPVDAEITSEVIKKRSGIKSTETLPNKRCAR